jgi:uncharacterized membrane protein
MKRALLSYGAALVYLLCGDVIWLGLIARGFYVEQLGPLLLDQPWWTVALLFYLVHAVGITVFAVRPALAAGSWKKAALLGALFGFCAFGTYDLTNLSTLRAWSIPLAVVDLSWGTVTTAIAATLATLFTRWVAPSRT